MQIEVIVKINIISQFNFFLDSMTQKFFHQLKIPSNVDYLDIAFNRSEVHLLVLVDNIFVSSCVAFAIQINGAVF